MEIHSRPTTIWPFNLFEFVSWSVIPRVDVGEKRLNNRPTVLYTDMSGLDPNWVRLAPNEKNLGFFKAQFQYFLARPKKTNLRLFKITFSIFWRRAPKYTETDLKKFQISPIWGQSDLI